MSLFGKCLMKWRDPKIKGMVTLKNILIAFILILFVSIPFGYLGGNGKYYLSSFVGGFAAMSLGLMLLVIMPLFPGARIQLTDSAIVRRTLNRRQKSLYSEIDCVILIRDCTYSWVRNSLVVKINKRGAKGPKFTDIEVRMKNDVVVDDQVRFSPGTLRMVRRFTVPEGVDVERVVQILRDKGIRIIEPQLAVS